MARTKQTARRSTGAKAPRQQLSTRQASVPVSQNNSLAQNLPLGSLPPKTIIYQPGGKSKDSSINPIEKYDDDDLLVDKPLSDKMVEEENIPTKISDQIHLTLKLKNKFLQINSASAQTYPMLASLS